MPVSTTSRSQNHEFAGKVAFITGAGSGIGRATTQAFAERGAAVAIADVSAEASRGVADEIVRRRQIVSRWQGGDTTSRRTHR